MATGDPPEFGIMPVNPLEETSIRKSFPTVTNIGSEELNETWPRAIVSPGIETLRIVGESDTARFVIVDQPNLVAELLAEPDRRRIVDSEIPGGMHRKPRLPGHPSDSPIPLRLIKLPGEIGAGDRCIETAFEFLGILIG